MAIKQVFTECPLYASVSQWGDWKTPQAPVLTVRQFGAAEKHQSWAFGQRRGGDHVLPFASCASLGKYLKSLSCISFLSNMIIVKIIKSRVVMRNTWEDACGSSLKNRCNYYSIKIINERKRICLCFKSFGFLLSQEVATWCTTTLSANSFKIRYRRLRKYQILYLHSAAWGEDGTLEDGSLEWNLCMARMA